MNGPGRIARSSGSPLAIVLLGLAVLVTAGLSWEAFRNARSARATAESVLRDYASFAAVQFARETQARLDPAASAGLSAVRHRAEGHTGDLVRPGARDCDCAPPAATQTTFILGETGPAFVDGRPLDPALVTSLVAELPTRRTIRHSIRVLDDGRLLVTAGAMQQGQPVLLGFIAGPSFLKDVFERVLSEAALLPGSLVSAKNTRQVLTLRVIDGAGRQLYRTDDEWSALTGRANFPSSFGTLLVATAVKPARAGELVIGGLPENRWPVVVGLLVLAAGLVTAAAVQLRREVRFARERADFISGVSHELRTPLAQIRLFGETLLLGRVRSQDEAHRAAQVIVQESRRLSQMVDNVLLFSRSDRQALTIRREPVDVVALVADVVGAFRPQASSKQMTIDVEAGGVPRSVLADPNVIRQVLLNLLDNAAKYGVRGQRIAVRLTGTPESVSLSVEDEGPGIAEADRSRIWEPFWRAPGSAEGGTGLGLAIVRDLVTLHGGTAAVERADVHGARFVATFRTPQTDVAAATPDGRPVDQPV